MQFHRERLLYSCGGASVFLYGMMHAVVFTWIIAMIVVVVNHLVLGSPNDWDNHGGKVSRVSIGDGGKTKGITERRCSCLASG